MKKNLKSIVTAGLVAGATMLGGKAGATTIDYINTVVNNSQDMDAEREGIQWRYDWVVHNESGGDWTSDAISQYTIQANLEDRGMYGFEVQNDSGWTYSNGVESRFDVGSGALLRSGQLKAFSAYIDADLITGNETVGSYGLSSEGTTNNVDVTVPVPEPMTMGLLGAGALATIGARRVKERYAQK